MEGRTILVVDDDVGDRKAIRRLLKTVAPTAHVHDARTAQEGLALDMRSVDAVLLDYMLPDGPGLTQIGAFLDRWPRSAIFILTGQGDEKVAKSSIQLGASDYISKDELTETAVERMLRVGIQSATARWKIEEQRRDLETFSEVLVHDLSAPVRALTYLVDQIGEDILDGEPADVEHALSLLRRSAVQMSVTLKSLSDHVRLDRDAAFKSATAQDLINPVMTALDREIEDAGAQVSVAIDPSLPRIECYPAQISQVLQNLIANGIKYAGNASPIIRIKASLEQNARICFEVADHGIGIAEEYRQRIFEPFKRVPGVYEIHGTGLGLATCRKIVDRHHGEIWCDPGAEGGSLFRFLIPVKQDQAVGF